MSEIKTVKTRVGDGTPGPGRPNGLKNKITSDCRTLAQAYGPAALKTLAKIMNNARSPAAARVSAAKELLDRAYGKAAQPVAVDAANFAEVFAKLIDQQPA